MAYTADDLVASVRRRAQLPSAALDGKVSDADILALADEIRSDTILPLILSAREGYYVTYSDTSLVAGQDAYRIPSRAVAGGLVHITYVDTNGNESPIEEITFEAHTSMRGGSSSPSWTGLGYAMRGDKVVLIPTPQSGQGSIRYYYHWRPGRLVLTTDSSVYEIDAIAGAVYTLDSATGLTTSTPVDIIQASPNFDLLLDNTAPSLVSAPDVTLTANLGASVGDYVCLTGVTPVMQAPIELHPLWVSATVVRVLMSVGDYEAAALEDTLANTQRENALRLIEPRNKGATRVIVNSHSTLRGSGYGGL